MAFVPVPVAAFTARPRLAAASARRVSRATTRAAAGPKAPEDFKAPEPRLAYVSPGSVLDIATGGMASFLRAGTGAFVEGYSVRREDGKIVEFSKTLPSVRPALPLRLFEFEACPFCRKVRECVNMLDLDVLVFPCPKDGVVGREYVKSKGGKTQFPYLEDPNTGVEMFESDDIIAYLYKTYGPQDARVPPVFGSIGLLSAGLASGLRGGKGRAREARTVPVPMPLEMWGYESSPFSKLVRERLAELEIPYLLHTTARGSPSRAILKELAGRIQTPYIVDQNTGVSMFESAEIVKYLTSVYGPDAPGAVAMPEEGTYFSPSSDAASAVFVVHANEAGAEVGVDVGEAAREAAEGAAATGSDVAKDVTEAASDATKDAAAKASDAVKTTAEKVTKASEDAASAVVDATESAETKAKSAVESAEEKLVDAVEPEQPSLDPKFEGDKALDSYCKDNPDSDECRVYED